MILGQAGAQISTWVFWAWGAVISFVVFFSFALLWRKSRGRIVAALAALALVGAVVGFGGYWDASSERRATKQLTSDMIDRLDPAKGSGVRTGGPKRRPGCGHDEIQATRIDELTYDPAYSTDRGEARFSAAQYAAFERFASGLENDGWKLQRTEQVESNESALVVRARKNEDRVVVLRFSESSYSLKTTRSACIASAMGIETDLSDTPSFRTSFIN